MSNYHQGLQLIWLILGKGMKQSISCSSESHSFIEYRCPFSVNCDKIHPFQMMIYSKGKWVAWI
ncbi:MAG TPA: hypothetical protein D7I06_04410 [Candidatus Poseidoniales archaeon]|nr:MAG TPA: hypothetical protein D7I06_04410 [Candidatus Poseidoniales archaeon]